MKLPRRTLAVDPPGASRTSAVSSPSSASLNPLREIHNHRHRHAPPPPAHKQPRLSQQQLHPSVSITSSSSSSASRSSKGKSQRQHEHRRHHHSKQQQPPAEKAGNQNHCHHAHAYASQHGKQQQRQRSSTTATMRSQRKRKVRFANSLKNQKYDNPLTLSSRDVQVLWYSPADIRAFQRSVKEPLLLRHQHAHYHAWTTSLHRVYHAFLALDNAQEIMAILQATASTQVFDIAGLGMERRAVGIVAEDASSRRRQLLAAVQKCQAAPVPDPWLRAQMLREMCRSVSKPSRLYARHIAHMTAVAPDVEDYSKHGDEEKDWMD